MRIVTLMEDTVGRSDLFAEHGLSFYIETDEHKIIFDTGASAKTWENAALLGIDISKTDTIVISHGHYDHTGGLLSLAEKCPDAVIYMNKYAAGDFYHNERYIGIDKNILSLPRLNLIEGSLDIDDKISIFSDVNGRKFWPNSNRLLSEMVGEEKVQDCFRHEQCMVLQEGDEILLFSGCAHNGVLNILDKFQNIYHTYPDKVFSGFHMIKKTPYTDDEEEIIRMTASELKNVPTRFYTGHCTGQSAFDIMKNIMGEKLVQFHSGDEII